MDENNTIDPQFFNHLDYGKLYMFVSSSHQAEAYGKLLQEAAHKYACWEKISDMQLVTVQVPEVSRLGMVIAARKINAGNIGRYAVLACVIKDASALDDGLVTFSRQLVDVTDDPVDNDDNGGDNTFSLLVPVPGVAEDLLESRHIRRQCVRRKGSIRRAMAPLKYTLPEGLKNYCLADEEANACVDRPTEAEIEIQRDDWREDDYADDLQQQRDHDLQLIQALVIDFIQKYHTDPAELIATTLQGKYIVNSMPMVVVNRDRKIVFPEYNEMELKMSAASRTLYIWFLRHPEGCKLSELKAHRSEITDIYLEVHPGCNYLEEAVDALLEGSKLNQNLSRIKKMVRGIIINDDIARHYYISGTRGGIYSLPIAADATRVRIPQEKV